jgi:glycerophosphoryl diester phosphodiesterase
MGSSNALHDRLLSHRLRGFSPFEGSLAGLRAALDQGVKWIEIDTRTAKDGTILVFHDSRLDRLTVEPGPVADYSVTRNGSPRYRGKPEVSVPTLEVFLREFAARRGATRLMLDIKDAGSEESHCRCIAAAGLDDSVWIIAWSPQVLRRVHEIAPQLRLGLSHVPLTRWRPLLRAAVRALGRGSALRAAGRLLARRGVDYDLQDVVVYLDEYDGVADPLERARGSFPVHFASSLPGGEVGEILRRTGGGVGTPAWFLTPDYVERAHRNGLLVFVYSVDTLAAAREAKNRCDVDIIFTNNPQLFSQARSER